MKLVRFLFFLVLSYPIFGQALKNNVSYVDPTIGGVGILLVPTRPTIHLPNSMVRVFPYKKDQLDDQISYFPLTISSHRHPHLFSFMPVDGSSIQELWDKRMTYDQEKTTPYYYSTRLEDLNGVIEFSPAERSGYFRVSFEDNSPHFIRLGIINEGKINQDGKRILTGMEDFKGMKAYFYAEVNKDIKAVHSKNRNILIEFSKEPLSVDFRYGISFISVEQAKENLQKEIPDWNFEKVQKDAQDTWEKVLSQITVEGGTEAQKRVFYTALYRGYERMININEYGKYYSAYDHKVHKSSDPFYVDNWLWDTYIALEPLYTILNPQMQEDKIISHIKMYEQSGWMPSFALLYGDFPVMSGNHGAAWIADSWFKGIQDFDLKKTYEGLKKNSLEATLLPDKNGPPTSLDSFYTENGYMPALHPGEKETVTEVSAFARRQAVSVTQENSYDDWCIAQMAGVLGKEEEKELFLERSTFYKNVFRAEKGFAWPKDDKGEWIEPFDPEFSGGQGGRDYFTENTGFTYDWNARHDLDGLFELMGGREKAEAKLDQLFREELPKSKYHFWDVFPDATGLVGQFSMGNEPSFHIPYLYNYLGSPWKTQKRIRMLLDTYFTDNLFGIPGDEDGGGMSAFAVFSMMGFFPVTPGIPVYTIGSPVFDKITIKLPSNKTFTIIAKNNSAANKYIQSITLNGKPLEEPWFTHTELMNGGTLEMVMGNRPNKEWGSSINDAPPSSINLDPSKFLK
ncbi:MAG TPA: GH92 family glycosyl hydrolase [Cytophagales bacterium]|nr:GH92 family glycosyl hydrolase [Cytophagales bacterium]